MPKKVEERTIDGIQYRVTQLGGYRATMLAFRVSRALAGVAAAVDKAQGASAESLLQLASTAAREMTPEDLAYVAHELADVTEVGVVDPIHGKSRYAALAPLYDDHFAGAPPGWLKWLAFALEVNLGSFFGGLVGLFRSPQAASSSNSPTTVPGSSGDSSPASAAAPAAPLTST
jgi:hypothetical protein